MVDQTDALGMLDLLTAPGFCVKENRIIRVNSAASGLFFSEGMDIAEFLSSGAEEYRNFTSGCLCLQLKKDGQNFSAFVTRQQEIAVFVLESDAAQPELQALALAARELRAPLNNAMVMADRLLKQEDPAILDQAARLNRGLYQLLRIVGNMSDAGYTPVFPSHTLRDMGKVMDEVFEKAQTLTEAAGLTLRWQGLSEQVFSLCDAELLERAVRNILSNAIKFSPKDSIIDAVLEQSGNYLRLSVQDSGSGIADNVIRSVFYRYLRQPTIEDSRYGIGLGMVLIRSAALQHGGTVLIDQPTGKGTRVTLTMAIRQDEPRLNCKIIRPVSGGYDSALIDFSEVLSSDMYNGKQ